MLTKINVIQINLPIIQNAEITSFDNRSVSAIIGESHFILRKMVK
jgi:hypothetical protein